MLSMMPLGDKNWKLQHLEVSAHVSFPLPDFNLDPSAEMDQNVQCNMF